MPEPLTAKLEDFGHSAVRLARSMRAHEQPPELTEKPSQAHVRRNTRPAARERKKREDTENHHHGQFASKSARHHRRIESSSLVHVSCLPRSLASKGRFHFSNVRCAMAINPPVRAPSTLAALWSINTTNSKKRYSRFLINDVVISSLDVVMGTLRSKSRP